MPNKFRAGWSIIGITLITATLGCRTRSPDVSWPHAPAREIEQPGGRLLGYDVDRDGQLDYLQRLRNGYKDQLLFPPARPDAEARDRAGRGWTTIERGPNAKRRPLLVLLLDGVSYDRIRNLYDAGHFRLFLAPTRIISTFPSLTDVAYDALFATGPTPGYEASYFDRDANRMSNGVRIYLTGANERWIRYVDYRMSFLRDALMYLMPQSTYEIELRNARATLDRALAAGRSQVALYLLSTDGLGHMLSPERLEQRLTQLDDWIERVVYDWRGEIDLVMMADHGNTTRPPRRLDLEDVLEVSGFRVVKRLVRPGDVVVPRFGLLDMARFHTYDAATRTRLVETLRIRPEVELIAWRDGDVVELKTADGGARIRARGDSTSREFEAEVLDGDPLGLRAVLATLRARAGDGGGASPQRASAGPAEWLAVTANHDFPAAVPRLWAGMLVLSAEQPDVIVSLREEWFVGSGILDAFADLKGTHGGLSRRSSETFLMSSRGESPVTLLLSDVSAYLRAEFQWPATGEFDANHAPEN